MTDATRFHRYDNADELNADLGLTAEEVDAAKNALRTGLPPHVEEELEAHLRPIRAAHPGISNGEAAELLPEHLRGPLWERAVGRYLDVELAKLDGGGHPMIPPTVADQYANLCCDMHNVHCEPPADLCCTRCTEAAHPEHPRGVVCVLDMAVPCSGPTPTQRKPAN